MKFKDTIGIYDNVFTSEECKALINRFENAHKEGIIIPRYEWEMVE